MKLSQLTFLCPLLLLPVPSYGETTKIGERASSTSTAKPTTHTVFVGGQNGNLTYEPMNTIADIGDKVVFFMRSKNHSVTQGAFQTPCQPLQQTSGTFGIFSGFLPPRNSKDDSHDFFKFEVTVNDTKPAWFYCSQSGHCKTGMVGAINAPPQGNTIEAFQALAIKSNITDPVIPAITGGKVIPPLTTHLIVVGGSDSRLVYEPSNITANIGDKIQFLMRAKNHSVTQGAFQTPCKPLIQTSGKLGIFSGFLPPKNASDDSIGDATFEFTVNDTTPIWYYCSQTNHCKAGLVGSINAPETGNTFAAFKQLALESNISMPYIPPVTGGTVIYPPSYWSSNGNTDLAESTAAHTAKSIAEGALIGIVVGAVGLLLLSVLAVYCCCCRRRKTRAAPGPERGDGGFMSYAASSYRSINSPVPGAASDKLRDYEPLVPPGEKVNAGNDDYRPSGAYDPPQPPSLGQYSTAWDQHK